MTRAGRRPISRRAALAKTGGPAITARSGTTPGSGTVTLYHLDGGSITAVVDLDSSPVTVTGSPLRYSNELKLKRSRENGTGSKAAQSAFQLKTRS